MRAARAQGTGQTHQDRGSVHRRERVRARRRWQDLHLRQTPPRTDQNRSRRTGCIPGRRPPHVPNGTSTSRLPHGASEPLTLRRYQRSFGRGQRPRRPHRRSDRSTLRSRRNTSGRRKRQTRDLILTLNKNLHQAAGERQAKTLPRRGKSQRQTGTRTQRRTALCTREPSVTDRAAPQASADPSLSALVKTVPHHGFLRGLPPRCVALLCRLDGPQSRRRVWPICDCNQSPWCRGKKLAHECRRCRPLPIRFGALRVSVATASGPRLSDVDLDVDRSGWVSDTGPSYSPASIRWRSRKGRSGFGLNVCHI